MNDPIIDEVRRVRDAHAARFNYDLDAIFFGRIFAQMIAEFLEHTPLGVTGRLLIDRPSDRDGAILWVGWSSLPRPAGRVWDKEQSIVIRSTAENCRAEWERSESHNGGFSESSSGWNGLRENLQQLYRAPTDKEVLIVVASVSREPQK